MSKNKRIGVTAALVAMATTAALSIDVVSTSAAPVRQTQTLHAEATAQLATATGFILADQDVQGATVVGHDILTCTVDSTGPVCDVAFAQAGGILDAHLDISDATGILTGTVRGGTGHYRHAYGTLSGISLSPTTVQITLHYCS